jgi:type IV pilus assembly protein PilB
MALKLGELFLKYRILFKSQITKALELQKKTEKRLGEILIKLGYTNPRQLAKLLSEQAGVPFVELRADTVNPMVIKSFPAKFLYENNVIPLYEIGNILYVAVGDPTNQEIINKLKEFTNKEIVLFGAEPTNIERLLDKFLKTDYRPHGYGIKP